MQAHELREDETVAFDVPELLVDRATHYCPGCHHGVAHRLVAEVLTEMGVAEDTICVSSIGCSVFIYNYLAVDTVEAPHGRAPAVATGVKRARKDKIVFAYQGDGDLASIGLAEIMHAANRGERMTIVFVNNTVYGMTGGQMAPTTLLRQKTTTTPNGRDPEFHGHTLHITDMIANLAGVVYAERVAATTPAAIRKTKKAIRTAFQTQVDGLGYSIVEVLSACPTNWKLSPIESIEWIHTVMEKEFPLGVLTDKREKKA